MNFDRLKSFLPDLTTYSKTSFFLIAGPCVVESEKLIMETAGHLVPLCRELEIPLIFKSSYRKANRTRSDSFTGIGDGKALRILQEAGESFDVPVTTDIHTEEEASIAAGYVDILQIPAFLSRQTSLLVAAAKTGKTVNIKKGQFLSPGAMRFAVDKVKEAGNEKVMVTERGTTFGYTDLLVDYVGLQQMKTFDVPVVLDCTHALQQPNQPSGVTGGRPHMIETLAKAAVAIGVDGLFIETHPQPDAALSDGANMLPLDQMRSLLEKLCALNRVVATWN